MRVIAGEAKGRRLAAPKGSGTRPATDRVREALFAIIEPRLPGAAVLDLFAGAGTLGIEALSRGAARARFVERGAEALRSLRANLATTRLADRSTVSPGDVLGLLDGRADLGGPYDLVFCDPPFADVAVLTATLAHPRLPTALAPGALVVARALRKHLPDVPERARLVRTKEIGEESLLFLIYDARSDMTPATSGFAVRSESARAEWLSPAKPGD